MQEIHVVPSVHSSFFRPHKLGSFAKRMSELAGSTVYVVEELDEGLRRQVMKLESQIQVFPGELKKVSGEKKFLKAYSLALRRARGLVRPWNHYENNLSIAALKAALKAAGVKPVSTAFFDEGERAEYAENLAGEELGRWNDKTAVTVANRLEKLPQNSVKLVYAGAMHWPSVVRELQGRAEQPIVHSPLAHKDYTWRSTFRDKMQEISEKRRIRHETPAGLEILEQELPERLRWRPGIAAYSEAIFKTLKNAPFVSRRISAKKLQKEIRRCGLEQYARERGIWPDAWLGRMASRKSLRN